MIKLNLLKELTEKITDALPVQFSAFKKDFEKSCHAILMQTLNKLDLVTREEFDTQTKVLQRTRKKLNELEKHLNDLEASLKKK